MRQGDWTRLARERLVPALPGAWVARSNLVLRLPTPHIAWVVTFQQRHGGFFLDALALPMFVFSDVLVMDVTNRHLGGAPPHGHFFDLDEAARIAAAPERAFTPLVEMVLEEGVPHLQAAAGSVCAYLDRLRAFAVDRHSGHGTVQTEHATAAAALLLGDLDSARTAYRNVLAQALPLRRPHPPWLTELVRTAESRLDLDDAPLASVDRELLRVEHRMRERWRLPVPEQPSPRAGLR